MLIDAERSCLVAVDLQARLLPAIHGAEGVIRQARLVLRAAARLGVPVLISEQYPKGLGPTAPEVAALAPTAKPIRKIAFSAVADDGFRARFEALERTQAVLLGTEAHVCVLQTGLDLLQGAVALFVVADAVGSRDPANARAALGRLERAGATIVTAEMVLFEWLRRADTPVFRELLPWIKDPGIETPPHQ
jgi:nicotinamidase-related amidase